MEKIALIVAGGSGTRMGSDIPKQFIVLNNLPILQHTINQFIKYDATMRIIIVLPATQLDYWQTLCVTTNFITPHEIVAGGATRFQSVSNGLKSINTTEAIVFVHDGVRPFVSLSVLDACYASALTQGNAVPALACNDSLRKINTQGGNKYVNRTEYKLIQTPQTFTLAQLKHSYATPESVNFTDDASVVEQAGYAIHLVQGNTENIKITTPFDLIIAQALLTTMME